MKTLSMTSSECQEHNMLFKSRHINKLLAAAVVITTTSLALGNLFVRWDLFPLFALVCVLVFDKRKKMNQRIIT